MPIVGWSIVRCAVYNVRPVKSVALGIVCTAAVVLLQARLAAAPPASDDVPLAGGTET